MQRYGQVARSTNDELVYGRVVHSSADNDTWVAGAVGVVSQGVCDLEGMVVTAELGKAVDVEIESPSKTLFAESSSVIVNIQIADECPRGSFLTNGGLCERCEKFKYLLHFSPNEDCRLCPKGADCAGGADLSTKKNFWRTSVDSDEVWKCPLNGACHAGSPDSIDVCNAGFMGVQCGVCAEDHYYVASALTCGPCAAISGDALGFFILTLGILAFFSLLCLGKAKAFVNARRRLRDAVWDIHKFKVVWSTMQVGCSRNAVAKETDDDQINMRTDHLQCQLDARRFISTAVHAGCRRASDVHTVCTQPSNFRFDLNSLTLCRTTELCVTNDSPQVLPVQCIFGEYNHYNHLLLVTVLPLLGVAALGLWALALQRQPGAYLKHDKAKKASGKCLQAAVFLLIMVLPSTSTAALRTFHCSRSTRALAPHDGYLLLVEGGNPYMTRHLYCRSFF